MRLTVTYWTDCSHCNPHNLYVLLREAISRACTQMPALDLYRLSSEVKHWTISRSLLFLKLPASNWLETSAHSLALPSGIKELSCCRVPRMASSNKVQHYALRTLHCSTVESSPWPKDLGDRGAAESSAGRFRTMASAQHKRNETFGWILALHSGATTA
jgi:hypothetical protein